jgi:GT2 family glycosyltransferase
VSDETVISIIIPAFNQLQYCQQCVQSLQRDTSRPFKLILVDNGSTDGVSEYFDSVPGATIVHTGKNLGFAAGINAGMQHAEGHVLWLNSDTLLPLGWLERLERALLSDDAIGMVGPRSNCVSGSQQIDGLEFTTLTEIDAYAEQRATEHGGELRDVARLVGFCVLIRDSVVAQLGGLDESYGIGNFEDDDYCVQVLRAGYRLCVAEDSFVFHYGSRTFAGMGILDDTWQNLIEENRRQFEAKWDYKPEERIDALQAARQHLRAAGAAHTRGDLAGAVRAYTKAIETAPMYEVPFNDLGAVLWEAGDHARALSYFQQALRRNPAYVEARDNLVTAAEALGRGEEMEGFLNGLPKT